MNYHDCQKLINKRLTSDCILSQPISSGVPPTGEIAIIIWEKNWKQCKLWKIFLGESTRNILSMFMPWIIWGDSLQLIKTKALTWSGLDVLDIKITRAQELLALMEKWPQPQKKVNRTPVDCNLLVARFVDKKSANVNVLFLKIISLSCPAPLSLTGNWFSRPTMFLNCYFPPKVQKQRLFLIIIHF